MGRLSRMIDSGKVKTLFKKTVSSIVAFTFLATSFYYDNAQASNISMPVVAVDSNPVNSSTNNIQRILDPKTFTLPENLGKVVDSWAVKDALKNGDAKLVIYIQDAHCNYGAQNSISEIIDLLNKEYSVNMVNLEGGTGDYDLSVFTDIKDKAIRAKVADYFEKEGILSGAESFAANNPEKVSLWGLENTELYIKNLNVYRDSLTYKNEAEGYIKAISRDLSALKTKIYSPELLSLDMKYTAYKAGNADLKTYLLGLTETAKNEGINLKSYPNIFFMIQTLALENTINFKRAETERSILVDELSKKLPKSRMEDLAAKTIEFRSGKVSQRYFYAYLLDEAKMINLEIDTFGELKKYMLYIEIFDAVDKSRIMDEMEGLENAVRASIYTNDDERSLNTLSKNLILLKNMFNISFTRSDHKYYKDNAKGFAAEGFISFIKTESPKYGITPSADEKALALDKFREEISCFYEYSFARDEVFIKNIKMNATPSANAKCAVMVSGGFHSENMYELFRKNNISYISIMPNFKNCDGYECPYFDLLGGKYGKVLNALSGSATSNLALFSFFCKDASTVVNGEMTEAGVKTWSVLVRAMFESDLSKGPVEVKGEGDNVGYVIGGEPDPNNESITLDMDGRRVLVQRVKTAENILSATVAGDVGANAKNVGMKSVATPDDTEFLSYSKMTPEELDRVESDLVQKVRGLCMRHAGLAASASDIDNIADICRSVLWLDVYLTDRKEVEREFLESFDLITQIFHGNQILELLVSVLRFADEAERGNEDAVEFVKSVAKLQAINDVPSQDGRSQTLPYCKSRKPYLDMASGPNIIYFTADIKQNAQVEHYLVDTSLFANTYLKMVMALRNIHNVEVKQEDVLNLNFKEGSLGAVRLKNLYTYVREQVLKQIVQKYGEVDLDFHLKEYWDEYWDRVAAWLEPAAMVDGHVQIRGQIFVQSDLSVGHRANMAEIVHDMYDVLVSQKGWAFDFKLGIDKGGFRYDVLDTVIFTKPPVGGRLDSPHTFEDFLAAIESDNVHFETDSDEIQSFLANSFGNIFGKKYAWLDNGLRMLLLAATPVHELGHILAAKLSGLSAKWTFKNLFTGSVEIGRAPPKVLFAGLVSNLVGAVLSASIFAALKICSDQPILSVTGIILCYTAVTNFASFLAELIALPFGKGDLARATKSPNVENISVQSLTKSYVDEHGEQLAHERAQRMKGMMGIYAAMAISAIGAVITSLLAYFGLDIVSPAQFASLMVLSFTAVPAGMNVLSHAAYNLLTLSLRSKGAMRALGEQGDTKPLVESVAARYAMKHMGSYESTIDEVDILKLRHNEIWNIPDIDIDAKTGLPRSFESDVWKLAKKIPGIKYAKVVRADLGGIPSYHFVRGQTLIIVLDSGIDSDLVNEAVYHELRETFWLTQKDLMYELSQTSGFPPERIAHIIASAEQVTRFGKDGNLTPYHAREIARMDRKALSGLIDERTTGGRENHIFILDEVAKRYPDVKIDLNYEDLVIRQAEAELGLGEPIFRIKAENAEVATDEIDLAGLVAYLHTRDGENVNTVAGSIKANDLASKVNGMSGPQYDNFMSKIRKVREHQFSGANRPIVEIIANAIDSYVEDDRRASGSVAVNVDDRGFEVIDQGKGMSLDQVLLYLLIPSWSSKRGEGELDIGRFGVGFYSVLNYLKHEGDKLVVETSNGQEGTRIVFYIAEGDGKQLVKVRFESIPTTPKGTAVRLILPGKNFRSMEHSNVIEQYLRFNGNAPIYVNGKPINAGIMGEHEGYKVVDVGKNDLSYSEKRASKGKAYILVNGVTIFDVDLVCSNSPETILINFPKDAKLTKSRDRVICGANEREFIKEMLSVLSKDAKNIDILNALYPVIRELQRNNNDRGDNLEHFYINTIKGLVTSSHIRVLPDVPYMGQVRLQERYVLIRPELFRQLKNYRPILQEFNGHSGGYQVFVAEFMSDDIVFVHDNMVVILNSKYIPHNVEEVAALEMLMGFDDVNIQFTGADVKGGSNSKIIGENIGSEKNTSMLNNMKKWAGNFPGIVSFPLVILMKVVEGIGLFISKIPYLDVFMPRTANIGPYKGRDYTFFRHMLSSVESRILPNDDMSKDPAYVKALEERIKKDVLGKGKKRVDLWKDFLKRYNIESFDFAKTVENILDLTRKRSESMREGKSRVGESGEHQLGSEEYKGMDKLMDDPVFMADVVALEFINKISMNLLAFFSSDKEMRNCFDQMVKGLRAVGMGYGECLALFEGIVKNSSRNQRMNSHDVLVRMKGIVSCIDRLKNVNFADGEEMETFLSKLATRRWLARITYPKFDRNSHTYLVFDAKNSSPMTWDLSNFYSGNDLDDIDSPSGSYRESLVRGILLLTEILAGDKFDQRYKDKYFDILGKKFLSAERGEIAPGELAQFVMYFSGIVSVEENKDERFLDVLEKELTKLIRLCKNTIDSDGRSQYPRVSDIAVKGHSLDIVSTFTDAGDAKYLFDYLQVFSDTVRFKDVDVSLRLSLWKTIMARHIGRSEGFQEWSYTYSSTDKEGEIRIWKTAQDEYEYIVNVLCKLTDHGVTSSKDVHRIARPYVFCLDSGTDILKKDVSPDSARIGGELNTPYSLKLSTLVALYLGGAMKDKNAMEKDKTAMELLDMARSGADTAGLITEVSRETAKNSIIESINYESSDEYIFIREIIQNVLDAKGKELDVSAINGRDWCQLGFTDNVGMSIERVVKFLLIPDSTTKLEDKEARGKFGQGFFTVLKDARMVRVKTSDGTGKLVIVQMTPVRKGELIVDVDISVEIKDDASFKGTNIEWLRDSDIPQLETAIVRSKLLTYGCLIDDAELKINWTVNNTTAVINKNKELMGQIETEYGKVGLYHSGDKENVVTHRGLYVREIDKYFWDTIPVHIREQLSDYGIIIDLPAGVELISDRSDVTNKEEILSKLQPHLAKLSIIAILDLFASNKVKLGFMPYDFMKDGRNWIIPNSVKDDAAALKNGQQINVAPYVASGTLFGQLIASIPFISLKGKDEHFSLVYVLEGIENGSIFLDDIVNENIVECITTVMKRKAQSRRQAEERREKGYKEFYDITLPIEGRRDDADVYWAFSEFMKEVSVMLIAGQRENLGSAEVMFYGSVGNDKAHAFQNSSAMGWNIYSNMELFDQFSKYLRDEIPPDQAIYTIRDMFSTQLHELAHMLENTGETTHNDEFFARQKALTKSFLMSIGEISKIAEKIKHEYKGTVIDVKSFANYLLEYRDKGVSPVTLRDFPAKDIRSPKQMSVLTLTKTYAQDHAEELLKLHHLIEGQKWTTDQLLADMWKQGEYGSSKDRPFAGKWEHSFVATSADGKPIGVLIAYERPANEMQGVDGAALYVHAIAVDPMYQGSGVGKRLMLELAEQLKLRGLQYLTASRGETRIALQTGDDNLAAQKFYFNLGFEEVGRKYYPASGDGEAHSDLVLSASCEDVIKNIIGAPASVAVNNMDAFKLTHPWKDFPDQNGRYIADMIADHLSDRVYIARQIQALFPGVAIRPADLVSVSVEPGSHRSGSYKDYNIVNVTAGDKQYRFGILAGVLFKNEYSEKKLFADNGIGPRVGDMGDNEIFKRLNKLEVGMVAVQHVEGETVSELIDRGDWKEASDIYAEILRKFNTIGFFGLDIFNNGDNVIKGNDGNLYIIDHCVSEDKTDNLKYPLHVLFALMLQANSRGETEVLDTLDHEKIDEIVQMWYRDFYMDKPDSEIEDEIDKILLAAGDFSYLAQNPRDVIKTGILGYLAESLKKTAFTDTKGYEAGFAPLKDARFIAGSLAMGVVFAATSLLSGSLGVGIAFGIAAAAISVSSISYFTRSESGVRSSGNEGMSRREWLTAAGIGIISLSPVIAETVNSFIKQNNAGMEMPDIVMSDEQIRDLVATLKGMGFEIDAEMVRSSIRNSNKEKNKTMVKEIYEGMRADANIPWNRDDVYPVLFVDGLKEEGFAMAITDIPLIIVPAENIPKDKKQREAWLGEKIAHEGTHIANRELVELGAMTRLEDEAAAYRVTAAAVEKYEPLNKEGIITQRMVSSAFDVIISPSGQAKLKELVNIPFDRMYYDNIKILGNYVGIRIYQDAPEGSKVKKVVWVDVSEGEIKGIDLDLKMELSSAGKGLTSVVLAASLLPGSNREQADRISLNVYKLILKRGLEKHVGALRREGVIDKGLLDVFERALNDMFDKDLKDKDVVTWHDYTHAANMALRAMEAMENVLKENPGMSANALLLTAIAAMYHDVGYYSADPFSGARKFGHEDRSMAYVRDHERDLGILSRDAARINLMISATKVEMGSVFRDLDPLVNKISSGKASADEIARVKTLLGQNGFSVDTLGLDLSDHRDVEYLLALIYGGEILATLDVYDTRPDVAERIDDLHNEFNFDRDTINQKLADEKDSNVRAKLEMLVSTLEMSKDHLDAIGKTREFYKKYADDRVAGFGVWGKYIKGEIIDDFDAKRAGIYAIGEAAANPDLASSAQYADRHLSRADLEFISRFSVMVELERKGMPNFGSLRDIIPRAPPILSLETIIDVFNGIWNAYIYANVPSDELAAVGRFKADTIRHSILTAELIGLVIRRMEKDGQVFSDQDVRDIMIAAIFHDIGKYITAREMASNRIFAKEERPAIVHKHVDILHGNPDKGDYKKFRDVLASYGISIRGSSITAIQGMMGEHYVTAMPGQNERHRTVEMGYLLYMCDDLLGRFDGAREHKKPLEGFSSVVNMAYDRVQKVKTDAELSRDKFYIACTNALSEIMPADMMEADDVDKKTFTGLLYENAFLSFRPLVTSSSWAGIANDKVAQARVKQGLERKIITMYAEHDPSTSKSIIGYKGEKYLLEVIREVLELDVFAPDRNYVVSGLNEEFRIPGIRAKDIARSIFALADGSDAAAKEFVRAVAELAALNEIDFVKEFKQKLPKDDSDKPYLDLASGPNIAYFSNDLGASRKYYFVDRSYYVSTFLERMMELTGHNNVEIMQKDILDLDFGDESLGTVRVKNLLLYAKVPDTYWDKAAKWITPGGQLTVQADPTFKGRKDCAEMVRVLYEKLVVKDGWSFNVILGVEAQQPFDSTLDTVTFVKPKSGQRLTSNKNLDEYLASTGQKIAVKKVEEPAKPITPASREEAYWHGSMVSFDKFDENRIGFGTGANQEGWGFSVTPGKENAKEYASGAAGKLQPGQKPISIKIKINGQEVNSFAGHEKYYAKRLFNIISAGGTVEDAREALLSEVREAGDAEMEKFIANADITVNIERYLYRIDVGEDPVWLELNGKPDKSVWTMIQAQASKEGVSFGKYFNIVDGEPQVNMGREIYAALINILGSDKEASLFLDRSGITGNKSGHFYTVFPSRIKMRERIDMNENIKKGGAIVPEAEAGKGAEKRMTKEELRERVNRIQEEISTVGSFPSVKEAIKRVSEIIRSVHAKDAKRPVIVVLDGPHIGKSTTADAIMGKNTVLGENFAAETNMDSREIYFIRGDYFHEFYASSNTQGYDYLNRLDELPEKEKNRYLHLQNLKTDKADAQKGKIVLKNAMKDYGSYLQYFVNTYLSKILAESGKRVVLWDEAGGEGYFTGGAISQGDVDNPVAMIFVTLQQPLGSGSVGATVKTWDWGDVKPISAAPAAEAGKGTIPAKTEIITALISKRTGSIVDIMAGVKEDVLDKYSGIHHVPVSELDTIEINVPDGVYHGVHASSIISAHATDKYTKGKEGLKVLVIGTGMGLEAYIAAKNGATVTAVDINKDAVKCTRDLCDRLGVGERVTCMVSDLFSALGNNTYDLIVFNMPHPKLGDDNRITKDGDINVVDVGERLLNVTASEVDKYLNSQGIAVLVDSEQTRIEKIFAQNPNVNVTHDFFDVEGPSVAYILTKKDMAPAPGIGGYSVDGREMLWNVDNAMHVPWKETVRDVVQEPESKTKTLNQKNYLNNQLEVRKMFLDLLGRMKSAEKIDFAAELKKLHDVLLLGRNGDSPYIPELQTDDDMVIADETGNVQKKRISKLQEYGTEYTDWGRGRASTDGPIHNALREFLNLDPEKTSVNEMIKCVAEFYNAFIQKDTKDYIFQSGNNSLGMNMVNGMLRLWLPEGIAHGMRDYDSFKDTLKDSLFSAVVTANKQINGETKLAALRRQIPPAPGPVSVDSGANKEGNDIKEYLNIENKDCPNDDVSKAIKIISGKESYDQVVLELGCGEAIAAGFIAKDNRRVGVIATDLYPIEARGSYGDVAREWQTGGLDAQNQRLPNLAIVRATAEIFSKLPDNSVDYIIFNNPASPVMFDIIRALMNGEIERVLKPGGKLFVKPQTMDIVEHYRPGERYSGDSEVDGFIAELKKFVSGDRASFYQLLQGGMGGLKIEMREEEEGNFVVFGVDFNEKAEWAEHAVNKNVLEWTKTAVAAAESDKISAPSAVATKTEDVENKNLPSTVHGPETEPQLRGLKEAEIRWSEALEVCKNAALEADKAIERMRKTSTAENREKLELAVGELFDARKSFKVVETGFSGKVTEFYETGAINTERYNAYLKDIEGTKVSNLVALEGRRALLFSDGDYDYYKEQLEVLVVGYDPNRPVDPFVKKVLGVLKKPSAAEFNDMLQLSIPSEIGFKFNGHGMWHSYNFGGAIRDLIDMLRKGIDPARAINEMPLSATEGSGSGFGATSPIDSVNGITIVSPMGTSLNEGGIKYVIMSEFYSEIIPDLQREFPNVKFVTALQAVEVLREEISKGSVTPAAEADEVSAVVGKTTIYDILGEQDKVLGQTLDTPWGTYAGGAGEKLYAGDLAGQMKRDPDGNVEFTNYIKALTDDLNRGVLNIHLLPAFNIEAAAVQVSGGKKAAKEFRKKMGVNTLLLHFNNGAGTTLRDQLKAAIDEAEKTVNKDLCVKIGVNVVGQQQEELEKIMTEMQLSDAQRRMIVIESEALPDGATLDNFTMDEVKAVIVGSAILNDNRLCVDFGLPAERLMENRRRMLTAFSESGIIDIGEAINAVNDDAPGTIINTEVGQMTANELDAIMREVYKGKVTLRINKVNWEELRDYEDSMAAVLKSL